MVTNLSDIHYYKPVSEVLWSELCVWLLGKSDEGERLHCPLRNKLCTLCKCICHEVQVCF